MGVEVDVLPHTYLLAAGHTERFEDKADSDNDDYDDDEEDIISQEYDSNNNEGSDVDDDDDDRISFIKTPLGNIHPKLQVLTDSILFFELVRH